MFTRALKYVLPLLLPMIVGSRIVHAQPFAY